MGHYEAAGQEASRKVVIYFLIILLIAAVVLTSIIGVLYKLESKNHLTNVTYQEQVNLKLQQKLINGQLTEIASDLLFLSKQNELVSLINDGNTNARSLLAGEYMEFSRRKRSYDQIRYIDETGMEVVRVNFNNGAPEIVGQDDLRPKGSRYYFKDIMKLASGDIFVSPFDLNIEDGAIEKPLKPMIRFGTPLFDKDKNPKGAIVLNYLGSRMTALIGEASTLSHGRSMLVNSDGYWLYSPVAEDEWGFMMDERSSRKFSLRFPDVWTGMLASDISCVYNHNGLFTSITIYPLKETVAAGAGLSKGVKRQNYDDYYWKLVSHTSTGELNSDSESFFVRLLLAGGILFLIASLPSWFISKSIVRRRLYLTKLYAAKQKAEAASVAKSQFLANMSHEIRTPMNGVIGMTSLLLETRLDGDQLNYTRRISNSADALLRIIDDILDYSKIEAGKLEFETIDFNIMTTIEEVVEFLSPAAFEKGLELVCMIHHDLPSVVRGDSVRLRQILMNLTGNAVKFTHSGGVSIHAYLEKEDYSTITIRFEIKDTGIGIPEDRIPLLFQSFSQVDGTTTRKYGGTGLGLVIAKQLCEMMGGKIGVESEEGEGTTFWFTAVLSTHAESQKIHFELPEGAQGNRILVVGENQVDSAFVKHQLHAWGFRGEEASDGREAFERLQAAVKEGDPFLIAIIDIHMPALDGEILGRMIKEDIVLCTTTMIMVSSMGEKECSKKANEIGFETWITKPVRQSALFDCITAVVGEKLVSRGFIPESDGKLFSSTRAERSNIRILLVDDDEMNRVVTATMLKTMGVSVDVANNGREAVDFLEKERVNIVLMDGQMPVMDGLEATERIRKNEQKTQKRPAHIIALTAHAMKGDREKFIAAGMNDYITKPLKKDVLAVKIDAYLKKYPVCGDEKTDVKSALEPDTDQLPIDMKEFLYIVDDNRALVDNCFNEFLSNSPGQLAEIKEAVDGQIPLQLEQAVHKLKGMLTYLSATRGVEIAEQLEGLAKENDMERVDNVWNLLKTECERITGFITEYKS